MSIPFNVKTILSALEQNGHQAYIVGGAVRDLLMGITPHDYDIATSARPEEVILCAKSQHWQIVGDIGRNFGVVMVVVDGKMFEIATFRGECYGQDCHRPERVWFANSIETDLARRDFTINAMAMTADGKVIDIYNGQRDINNKIIRTVGDPALRFKEDGLRMFRACRFASQLGFNIDRCTLDAIPKNLARVNGLSLERVRGEFEKILLAPHCARGLDYLVKTGLNKGCCRVKEDGTYREVPLLPELSHLVGMKQNPAYHHYDVWEHTLVTVQSVEADLVLRWGALLHDVAKGLPHVRGEKAGQPTDYQHDSVGAEMAKNILMRWRLSPKVIKLITWLIARHMKFYFYLNNNRDSIVRWLREEARGGIFRSQKELKQAFALLTQLCMADIMGARCDKNAVGDARDFGKYLAIKLNDMPVHTCDLCYSAEVLAEVLGSRQYIGQFLRTVLRRVQDKNLANTEEAITAAARRWVQRRKNQS